MGVRRAEGRVTFVLRWWALSLAAMLIAASGALATTPPRADAQPGGGGDPAEAVIVMDASSSMLVEDVEGSRLDVAKRAATDMVRELPDTARVAMLAYGAGESDAPDNREAGCRDVRTLSPMEEVDHDRLVDELNGLDARGYTPIGHALEQAAAEFTGQGERTIVLVSDGLDTCAPPDPCEVAADLAADGVGLTVHAVGFRVDDEARAQLECITGATGGEYRSADDADALTESMRFLSQRAIVGYETSGTPFDLADSPEEALYLGEGLYRTRVQAAPGEYDGADPRYFALAVPDGHRAWVSGTVIPSVDLRHREGGQRVNVQLELEHPDVGCEPEPMLGRDHQWTPGGAHFPQRAAVVSVEADDAEGCDMSRWHVSTAVYVDEWRGATDEEFEVEYSVQFEPIVSGDELETLPEGDGGTLSEREDGDFADSAEIALVTPGSSFNEAVAIDEGSHRASIVPGETHFYRLDVDWNQRPVVAMRTGRSERGELEQLTLHVSNPMRKQIASFSLSAYRDRGAGGSRSIDRLVNYRNREANTGGLHRSMAGPHYIAVSMNATPGAGGPFGVDHPYELSIALDGEAGEGPDWRPVLEPGPEPSDSPPTHDASTDETTGDASGDDVTTTADDESPTATTWALVAGGVAVLGLGLLAGWIFSRSRRG